MWVSLSNGFQNVPIAPEKTPAPVSSRPIRPHPQPWVSLNVRSCPCMCRFWPFCIDGVTICDLHVGCFSLTWCFQRAPSLQYASKCHSFLWLFYILFIHSLNLGYWVFSYFLPMTSRVLLNFEVQVFEWLYVNSLENAPGSGVVG